MFMVEEIMVEKFMVEEFMVEESSVEMPSNLFINMSSLDSSKFKLSLASG